MRGLALVAPWACALATLSPFVDARAGDTTGGDSTTSSDSGSTSDSGASEDAGDEFCGDRCSGTAEVTFASPSDGAVVPPSFTVTLEATDDCYCDTCGCFPEASESLGLALDGENVGSCAASPCVIEVVAEPGEHTLTGSAQWFFSEDSMSIEIHVDGDAATEGGSAAEGGSATEGGDEAATQAADDTTPGGDTESNESTVGAGDDDDDDDGCSCRTRPSGSGAWALALPLALLGAFARPRRLRR